MEAAFLSDYVIVTIVGICVCIGYVIKTSLDFIPNKYIPLIMLAIGTAANVLVHLQSVTLQVVLVGMVSGLASTGGYEAVHQLVKNYGNSKGTDLIEGIDDEEEKSSEGEDDNASS